MGDLYAWAGFVVKIDGVEVYRGVFRAHTMSAIPAPPSITILFPSVVLPSETENYGAIRMFYPSFQPPGDLPANNARLLQYFDRANKLVY